LKISEKYSRARFTSNLKSSPRTVCSASDVIAASGMAAQEHEDAMLLWSIMYGGNSAQVNALASMLSERVRRYATINRLKVNPINIAMSVLAHYLYAKCDACGGEGHQIVPHTITRHDDPCESCHGTGKPEVPNDEAWQWLNRYVSVLLAKAAGKVLEKIDLDL